MTRARILVSIDPHPLVPDMTGNVCTAFRPAAGTFVVVCKICTVLVTISWIRDGLKASPDREVELHIFEFATSRNPPQDPNLGNQGGDRYPGRSIPLRTPGRTPWGMRATSM